MFPPATTKIMIWVYTPVTALVVALMAPAMEVTGTVDVVAPLALIGLSAWALAINLNTMLFMGVGILLVASLAPHHQVVAHTDLAYVRMALLVQALVPAGIGIAAWLIKPKAYLACVFFSACISIKRIVWDEIKL
jgi:hypothetical protein